MLEEKPIAEHDDAEEGEVVYRRVQTLEEREENAGGKRGRPGSGLEKRISPALPPLIIGFALLLTVIVVLGRISLNRLEQVSIDILNLERGYAGKLSILLELRLALTNLNNEARARARVEGNRGLLPPLNIPLRNARAEVDASLNEFGHLPAAATDKGLAFRADLNSYLSITEDLNRYSLEGFEAFRKTETTLEEFLAETRREREVLPGIIEESKRQARREIFLLTLLGVLTSTVVAALTIWEVQRRFREIRKNLDALRQERQFSTQMLEGMVSAIAAIDRHDRIRSANAAFFKLFPEAHPGTSIYDDFASPEGKKMLAAASSSRVKRSTYRGRWRLTHEGAERAFDVYSSPLQIDGEGGLLITLVDATEAAKAETELRQQESLAAVGQAAAQVAHEIKNPLGSIRLGVAMLRDMTDNREAHSTIDLVERGIDHLNKLTLDVTQFSRRKQLSLTEVDLHQLLDASLDLVADKIKEKQTPIEKHFNAQPIRLEADADQLRQVFVNLFANAVDASSVGAPVTISTERVSAERNDGGRSDGGNGNSGRLATFARTTVADQGAGMDEATRARIFEPFFTTKKRGTGLGLAIARQIIEQHGGRINVASAPGKGTRFTIDLPIQ